MMMEQMLGMEQLLGDMPAHVFIDEYYLRLPLAMPGRASQLTHLGTWATVEAILARPEADVLVAREGKLGEGARPTYAEARALHASGHTVLVPHAERHHAGLAGLASRFQEDFGAPINIHLYCTPANQHGFGWHYDVEDVFVVQTQGSKQYRLRKNTVHPLPLVETIPKNMALEREITPTFECTLLAGDWLYIPAGYWHVATAGEDAISLAIGVMQPTAIDALDFLRQTLRSSPMWRQRLPVTGLLSPLDGDALTGRYRSLLAELGADLARQIGEERFLRAFLAALARKNRDGEPSASEPSANQESPVPFAYLIRLRKQAMSPGDGGREPFSP
jgi:ribosomal protein L16 Arg81 hydroxylase